MKRYWSVIGNNILKGFFFFFKIIVSGECTIVKTSGFSSVNPLNRLTAMV